MRTLIKLISLLSLLFMVALPVYAQSAGNVELTLSPTTGPIYITTGTDIQIILKPQGRDIVAVDFGLSYVGSDLILSDGVSNASYDFIKTGSEGDWRITYTRQFGKSMPVSDQTGQVILGTVHLTPSASKQSGSVLVRIIAPAGYSNPLITLVDTSQLPGNQVIAGSGTYDIGVVTTVTPPPACTADDLILQFSNTVEGSYVSYNSPSLSRAPGSTIYAKAKVKNGDPAPNSSITYHNADVRTVSTYTPGTGLIIGTQDIIFDANRSDRTDCNVNATITVGTAAPNPVKPTLSTPASGATVITGSSLPFAWTQMLNPKGGTIKAVGLRVVKAAAVVADNGKMDCVNAVVDMWWYTTGNTVSGTPCTTATQKQALEVAASTFPVSFSGQSLPPGTYYAAVFNQDSDGFNCSMNCNGSGNALDAFTSNQSFTVSCPVATPNWNPTSNTCQVAQAAQYRISTSLFQKNDQQLAWRSLSELTANTLDVSQYFKDLNQGQSVTFFVQFKDNNSTGANVSDVISRTIKYIGPNPTISNIACGFNSDTGIGSKVTILGDNLGDAKGQGKVSITGQSDSDVTVSSWGRVTVQITDSATATSSASPAATTSAQSVASALPTQNKVVLKVKNRLDGAANVTLTTDDGRQVVTNCTVDTNTVTFTAQAQCRQPGSFAASNVRVQIYENTVGAKPIYESLSKLISLDASGIPQWTAPPLEIGHTYELVVRAPSTLAVKKEFTVLAGTNDANNGDSIALPVGDIFPLGAPDGVVNSLDKSELVREWSALRDTVKAGDFNLDGRVNSLDYSCMRQNINKTSERFVK